MRAGASQLAQLDSVIDVPEGCRCAFEYLVSGFQAA